MKETAGRCKKKKKKEGKRINVCTVRVDKNLWPNRALKLLQLVLACSVTTKPLKIIFFKMNRC